ncbi:MAG: RNA methyltransferase [Thiomonas sp.]|uniref:RNA methyltransferase n=1 Tax=Thiomonas sp. TaxID=2047785 RepID=UPI002A37050B|nr:RNA methyltransferase [Thiomonas sp.]MDY0328904.1 RNA methyltransferase [Thiomonas sp.]
MKPAHFIDADTARPARSPDATVFVLVGASHPGNVGAAARALKNMGFDTLRLVAPRFADVLTQPETLAFASGAEDVLRSARVHGELPDAVADCGVVVALSARVRDFGPPLHTPEWLPQLARRSAEQGRRVAFVFGSERFGLSNADVYRCDALLSIPANPAYTSLNLAQAVQVIAWEWRKAVGLHAVQPAQAESVAATAGEIQGMMTHVEQALLALEVLDPDAPRKLLPRLQRLASRAELTREEVQILRGVCTAILRKVPPR